MKIECYKCEKLFSGKNIVLIHRERYSGLYGGDGIDCMNIHYCKKCYKKIHVEEKK